MRTACSFDVPLVSVIIPAYNAETFLEATLTSILTQRYQNLEVIVIDDGSTDRTLEIVEAIAARDPRLKVLRQSNRGVASARNSGIQAATGEFIAPIDADDIWYPEAISKLVAPFQSCDERLGVVYTWSVDIDEQAQPTGGFHAASVHGNVYKTLLCHNFLGNASSTLIRKTCLERVGGYNTQLRIQNAQGCEDWDLYLRLAEHYLFQGVSEFLVGYRNIPNSMSGDFSQMARSQQLMLQTVQQKHPEIPRYLYRLSRSSYYLYLARQCDERGQVYPTLHWLWQTIKIDPITPIGRLGFYILLVKNLIRLIGKRRRTSRTQADDQSAHSSISSEVALNSWNEVLASRSHLGGLPISQVQIWLKLFVGQVLHQSLLRL